MLDADVNGGYSFSVDIWSVGVMIFTLLIGKEPFYSQDAIPAKTYAKIRAGVYSFQGKEISEDAKDIIR